VIGVLICDLVQNNGRERERERKKEASSEQFKKWERIFEVE